MALQKSQQILRKIPLLCVEHILEKEEESNKKGNTQIDTIAQLTFNR